MNDMRKLMEIIEQLSEDDRMDCPDCDASGLVGGEPRGPDCRRCGGEGWIYKGEGRPNKSYPAGEGPMGENVNEASYGEEQWEKLAAAAASLIIEIADGGPAADNMGVDGDGDTDNVLLGFKIAIEDEIEYQRKKAGAKTAPKTKHGLPGFGTADPLADFPSIR